MASYYLVGYYHVLSISWKDTNWGKAAPRSGQVQVKVSLIVKLKHLLHLDICSIPSLYQFLKIWSRKERGNKQKVLINSPSIRRKNKKKRWKLLIILKTELARGKEFPNLKQRAHQILSNLPTLSSNLPTNPVCRFA